MFNGLHFLLVLPQHPNKVPVCHAISGAHLVDLSVLFWGQFIDIHLNINVRDDLVFLRLAVFRVIVVFLLWIMRFCHCAVFIGISNLSFLLSRFFLFILIWSQQATVELINIYLVQTLLLRDVSKVILHQTSIPLIIAFPLFRFLFRGGCDQKRWCIGWDVVQVCSDIKSINHVIGISLPRHHVDGTLSCQGYR